MIRHLRPSQTFYPPVFACVDVFNIRKVTCTKLLVDKLRHAMEIIVGLLYENRSGVVCNTFPNVIPSI